jgi:alpha-galactosidase
MIKYLLPVLIVLFTWSCSHSDRLTADDRSSTVNIKNSDNTLWVYQSGSRQQEFAPPVFEIENRIIHGVFSEYTIASETMLQTGVIEYTATGPLKEMPEVTMSLVVRTSKQNPVARFRYILTSEKDIKLTKSEGADRLIYYRTSLSGFSSFKEITLSTFNVLTHAFHIDEKNIGHKDFENELPVMGPLFSGENGEAAILLTYEHGSQLPDSYLQFNLKKNNEIELSAVKGNYYSGQLLNENNGFLSPWMNIGIVNGGMDQLAMAHREHVLKYMTENRSSREPYIFYNTWNYQERNQAWNKKAYLHEMNLKRMLDEIEVAHQMGIDVFVVDAGWFGKTGDWIASETRFPDDLAEVKAKLDNFGMKLGLWFNADAALTSNMLERNRGNIMTYNGNQPKPHEVWETEASLNLCLVSSFKDDYAEELIRVARKYGVTYFKWDAFRQYGCNAADHFHGNESNSPEERGYNYSFQLPIVMAEIADKISEAIPGAIVDFDVTEGQRAMGLGFLGSGKYFAINNGPYYWSLDDPLYATEGGMGANVLVFPGLARANNARSILNYDKWIPSILFLTHYLPDDPEYSQWVNLGSLILGQNGIWGDLLTISDEGVQRFGQTLAKYKEVRNDIVNSYPVRSGSIGGNPEIHEKIDAETGKGVIVIFNNYKNVWNRNSLNDFAGKFNYVSSHKVNRNTWDNGGTSITFDEKGRAVIAAKFDGPGAKIIFFGVGND